MNCQCCVRRQLMLILVWGLACRVGRCLQSSPSRGAPWCLQRRGLWGTSWAAAASGNGSPRAQSCCCTSGARAGSPQPRIRWNSSRGSGNVPSGASAACLHGRAWWFRSTVWKEAHYSLNRQQNWWLFKSKSDLLTVYIPSTTTRCW